MDRPLRIGNKKKTELCLFSRIVRSSHSALQRRRRKQGADSKRNGKEQDEKNGAFYQRPERKKAVPSLHFQQPVPGFCPIKN